MSFAWTKTDYEQKVFNPEFKYRRSSYDQTKVDYGNYDTYWKEKKKKIIASHQTKVQLFGNPLTEDFVSTNIIKFDISPYTTINFTGSRYFGAHKLLVPAYRRVFEKWAVWGGYPWYRIGSSYDPRYASPDTTNAVLNARVKALGEHLSVWLTNDVQQLKKIPGLENKSDSDWKWSPRLLFFYDRANKNVKESNLSNHTYGTAIDINPRTNNVGDTTWDMPGRLVEIFKEEGFDWGGYYRSPDSMHFEYKLEALPRALPVIFGPFSPGSGEPPAKMFAANETGEGGFYPFGINHNLHGGIHLKPQEKTSLVRSTLPGYIVAARLLSKDIEKQNTLPYAFCSGHLGLVLVRHTGSRLNAAGAPEGDPISWYALYLHLQPPQYSTDADDSWNKVPWYKRLLLAKNGAAVVLDKESAGYEQNVWLKEALVENATDAKGILFGNEEKSQSSDPLVLKVRSDDGLRLLVPKPSPEDVVEAITSLQKGALITFHRPFLTVKANEPLGVTGEVSVTQDGVFVVNTQQARNIEKKSGYIHWEWLSPPGSAGLEGLSDIMGFKGVEMPVVEELCDDNFFDNNELEQLFKNLLPENERNIFSDVVAKKKYDGNLKTFFQKTASFSSSKQSDLTGTGQADTSSGKLTYAVTFDVSLQSVLPAPTAGQVYTIEFDFLVRTENGEKSLSKGEYKVTDTNFSAPITLQVPVETELIRAKSTMFHIETVVGDESSLQTDSLAFFKDLITRRWRGCLLKHLNEWSTDRLSALLEVLKKNKIVQDTLQLDVLKLLTWYNRTQNPDDPFSENPILGAEGAEYSLFSAGAKGVPAAELPYLLPSETELFTMNPVTGNWLVALLQQHHKFQVSSTFTLWEPQNSDEIWWWSIMRQAGREGHGEQMDLVAIAREYPNGSSAVIKLEKGSRSLRYEVPFVNGLARQRVQLLCWDAWKLVVDGAPAKAGVDGGIVEISPVKPVILGPLRWNRNRNGTIMVRVFFLKRCPETLDAFLNSNTVIASGERVFSGYTTPVRGSKWREHAFTKDATGLYAPLSQKKAVSTYYSNKILQRAVKAGGDEDRIALSLLWVLEALYECWKKEFYVAKSYFVLEKISAGSCTAQLQFSQESIAENMFTERLRGNKNIFPEGCVCKRDGKIISITIDTPASECGEWSCIINPAKAFGAVLQDTEENNIKVDFELYIPNGTDFTPFNIDDGNWCCGVIKINKSKIENDYLGEIVAAGSIDTQSLKPARFGQVHYYLKKLYKRSEQLSLEVIQILEGSTKDWLAAKPKLEWEFRGEKKESLLKVPSSQISVVVPFDEEVMWEPPLITGSVLKKPAVFDGIELEMPGLVTREQLVPQLVAEDPVFENGTIKLVVWGDLIPPDLYCKITVEKTGATEEENGALNKKIVYAPKGAGAFGVINGGKYRASLSKKGLKRGDVLTFSYSIVDGTSEDQKKIFGRIIDKTSTTITVE